MNECVQFWGCNDEEVWCIGTGPQAKGGDPLGLGLAGARGF